MKPNTVLENFFTRKQAEYKSTENIENFSSEKVGIPSKQEVKETTANKMKKAGKKNPSSLLHSLPKAHA